MREKSAWRKAAMCLKADAQSRRGPKILSRSASAEDLEAQRERGFRRFFRVEGTIPLGNSGVDMVR